MLTDLRAIKYRVIFLWNTVYFRLNLGIRHLCLNALSTEHYFSFVVSEMNEIESNKFDSSALNIAV